MRSMTEVNDMLYSKLKRSVKRAVCFTIILSAVTVSFVSCNGSANHPESSDDTATPVSSETSEPSAVSFADVTSKESEVEKPYDQKERDREINIHDEFGIIDDYSYIINGNWLLFGVIFTFEYGDEVSEFAFFDPDTGEPLGEKAVKTDAYFAYELTEEQTEDKEKMYYCVENWSGPGDPPGNMLRLHIYVGETHAVEIRALGKNGEIIQTKYMNFDEHIDYWIRIGFFRDDEWDYQPYDRSKYKNIW